MTHRFSHLLSRHINRHNRFVVFRSAEVPTTSCKSMAAPQAVVEVRVNSTSDGQENRMRENEEETRAGRQTEGMNHSVSQSAAPCGH